LRTNGTAEASPEKHKNGAAGHGRKQPTSQETYPK